MNENKMIKSITLEEDGYIVVIIQDQFHDFLQNEQLRLILKNMAKDALKEDFQELGVSKQGFRIKVQPENKERSLKIVEEEISKNIEMAWMFLNNFSGQ